MPLVSLDPRIRREQFARNVTKLLSLKEYFTIARLNLNSAVDRSFESNCDLDEKRSLVGFSPSRNEIRVCVCVQFEEVAFCGIAATFRLSEARAHVCVSHDTQFAKTCPPSLE